jgi:O-antigen ligase
MLLLLVLVSFGATYWAGSLTLPFGSALLLVVPAAIVVCALAVGQGAHRLRSLLTRLSWWHGLWLLLYVSGMTFRIRSVEDIRGTPVDAWAAFRIALVSITALVLAVRLVLRQTDWFPSLFRGVVGAMAIYCLVCGTSTLWSLYPAWTLYKAAEFLVDVALIAAILVSARTLGAWKGLFDWVWLLTSLLSFTVWIEAAVAPAMAFQQGTDLLPGRLNGIFPAYDENSVGEDAAVLAIVALSRLLSVTREKRGRAFYFLVLAYALTTLVFSQTRTAIVGFLLGATLVFFFSKRRGMLTALVLGIVLLFGLTTAGALADRFWQRNEQQETIETFTGRLPLWEASWKLIQERPFTGYGAYAAGRFGVLTDPDKSEWSSVLNTYVEVLVGTGIAGLIPLFVALFGAGWVLLRASSHSYGEPLEQQLAIQGLGVLSILTVRSIAGPEMIWHHATSFLVVLGYAEFLRRKRKSGYNA